VVPPRQLDDLRPGGALSDVAPGRAWYDGIVAGVEHERRHADGGQHVAHAHVGGSSWRAPMVPPGLADKRPKRAYQRGGLVPGEEPERCRVPFVAGRPGMVLRGTKGPRATAWSASVAARRA